MDNKLLRIWLASKTSGATWRGLQLEECFGSVEAAYNAGAEEYMKLAEMSRSVAHQLCDKSLDGAKRIIEDCEKFGIDILTPEDEYFPKVLLSISSPVQVLYSLGKVPDWDEILSVAVVGTRYFTEYGQTATERISRELAEEGVTIVSGMARGIDSFALKSALRVGAPTVAVMGCGLETAYPAENRKLMDSIIETGCALSEYPPYAPPKKEHFPQRNRIVSGIADAVLAVEAPLKSGTLITARLAMEMGRTLFAVPGNIFAKNSKGTNMLIKNGALPATCGEDILEAFPIRRHKLEKPVKFEPEETPKIEEKAIDGISEEENKVIALLKTGNMHIEELAARVDMTIPELNGILPMLEIEGYVVKLAGNIYKFNV